MKRKNLPQTAPPSKDEAVLVDMPTLSLKKHRSRVARLKARYEKILVLGTLSVTTLICALLVLFLWSNKMYPQAGRQPYEFNLEAALKSNTFHRQQIENEKDSFFKIISFDANRIEVACYLPESFYRRCLVSYKPVLDFSEFWSAENFFELVPGQSQLSFVVVRRPKDMGYVFCGFSLAPREAAKHAELANSVLRLNERPLRLFLSLSDSLGKISLESTTDGKGVVAKVEKKRFVSHRCVLVYEADVGFLDLDSTFSTSFQLRTLRMSEEKFEEARVFVFDGMVDSPRHKSMLEGAAQTFEYSYEFAHLFSGEVVVSCSLMQGAQEYLAQGLLPDDERSTVMKRFRVSHGTDDEHDALVDRLATDSSAGKTVSVAQQVAHLLNVYRASPHLDKYAAGLREQLQSFSADDDNHKELLQEVKDKVYSNGLLLAKYFHYILLEGTLKPAVAEHFIPFEADLLLPVNHQELEEVLLPVVFVAELLGKTHSRLSERHNAEKTQLTLKIKNAISIIVNDLLGLSFEVTKAKDNTERRLELWKEYIEKFKKDLEKTAKLLKN